MGPPAAQQQPPWLPSVHWAAGVQLKEDAVASLDAESQVTKFGTLQQPGVLQQKHHHCAIDEMLPIWTELQHLRLTSLAPTLCCSTSSTSCIECLLQKGHSHRRHMVSCSAQD
jgi:hypothetical protein